MGIGIRLALRSGVVEGFDTRPKSLRVCNPLERFFVIFWIVKYGSGIAFINECRGVSFVVV